MFSTTRVGLASLMELNSSDVPRVNILSFYNRKVFSRWLTKLHLLSRGVYEIFKTGSNLNIISLRWWKLLIRQEELFHRHVDFLYHLSELGEVLQTSGILHHVGKLGEDLLNFIQPHHGLFPGRLFFITLESVVGLLKERGRSDAFSNFTRREANQAKYLKDKKRN